MTKPRFGKTPKTMLMRSGLALGNQKTRLLGSFKKGGTVKKTGTYKLHKGEKVVPKKRSAKKKRG